MKIKPPELRWTWDEAKNAFDRLVTTIEEINGRYAAAISNATDPREAVALDRQRKDEIQPHQYQAVKLMNTFTRVEFVIPKEMVGPHLPHPSTVGDMATVEALLSEAAVLEVGPRTVKY